MTALGLDKDNDDEEETVDDWTMRDDFAAAALTGLIINTESHTPTVPITARAYELADAMLARRKQ